MTERRHILYIDDDVGLRRLVEKQLGRRGYDVVGAATGSEGVALAEQGGFEIIAVDHYMPDLDGLTTLAMLKKLPNCPPIVYVTGSEESRIAVAALKAGAVDYVVKSPGGDFVDLLEQTFEQALSNARLETEKAAADEALKVSNERLHALLREVNHRVANSLQLVSTMVGMQSRHLEAERGRDALIDTQRRIDAIAQVHRKLYTSNDVHSIAMDEYLAALISELEETWSTNAAPREIRLRSDPFRLHADKAISLGVIVNELVTNACKYAYPVDSPGVIHVDFSRESEGHFNLSVEDEGCGMPADAAPRGTGLGTKLITAMARSLGSEVIYGPANSGGVRASLRAAA